MAARLRHVRNLTGFASVLARRSIGLEPHWKGQKHSAATVKVASTQLDSVRVEQNHCQALQTVRASCAHDDISIILVRQNCSNVGQYCHL